MSDLLSELLVNHFDARVVTAEVTSHTADVARLRLAGGDAILPRSEWYEAQPLPPVGTVLQLLVISGDGLPVCSATSPLFPQALFEAITPEARTGAVRVMGVARAAGKRTKVAVAATVAGVDPIAACVGKGANRVRYVSELLGGERVDVVAWHPDPAVYVANALAPAAVEQVVIADGTARVAAANHQMAAAVGAGGQNSALASRLVGIPVSVTAAV
jgi:transcription termination/antitermination protein NusA